ncbi:LexA-binding hydrolase [Haloferula helveola]|uniref:LexA-binding hydrolase n=1 Tax=Haloferula helveola TaxID=490095 RepID=A0ABM7RBR4_9BACT|nr:LexA-binding hydrolase [Haloferula helveola]
MDSITQAALGATVGALVLGRKLGRPAIGWGALFGTLPDLDALVTPFLDTAWDLRLHRGFTHSLLCLLLVSFGLAKPLAKRWKKQKVTPQRAGTFVFLAWSTHILIDCFTVYGTQVLWPFSMHPVSFDNLFIIDPLFTLPMLVAVVWGLFIDAKKWKKGVGIRMTSVCLLISGLYVGLSFWAKHAVSSAFERDLARRGIGYERRMETPAPFSILLWRGVVDRGDEFWIGYRSIFDGDAPVRWTIFTARKDAGEIMESPTVGAVERFSKGWMIARGTKGGVWLMDLRFGEYREWDKRGLELRPGFAAWEYRPESRGDPMKSTAAERDEKAEMLRRMWARICGDIEGWEAKPRLIGNPSVPQEYLGTVE